MGKYPIPFLFTFEASYTCSRLSDHLSSSFHNDSSTCDCCRRWLVRSQRSSYCLSKWWQRPSPRQEQLLWRQLDQSHLRYQWCSHTIASRPGNPGQCQAVLRRYSEVSSRQGKTRPDPSPYISIRSCRQMAARCFQPRPYTRFSAWWPLLSPNASWSRCQIPGYGHHLRLDAETRRAARVGSRASPGHQEGQSDVSEQRGQPNHRREIRVRRRDALGWRRCHSCDWRVRGRLFRDITLEETQTRYV